jgi:urease accessory protein
MFDMVGRLLVVLCSVSFAFIECSLAPGQLAESGEEVVRTCVTCLVLPPSSPGPMDPDTESYILLLLADSNLPTGAFVASAGLESYITHGFFGATIQSVIGAKPPSAAQVMADGHIHFLQDNLDSYARSALPFVTDGHTIASLYLDSDQDIKDVEATLSALRNLDALYESMTLNHVARRASRTQGVALLTLYSRGFTHPPTTSESPQLSTAEFRVSSLIDAFKLAVRREDTPGHLPICWAILTAALGLSVGKYQGQNLAYCSIG